MDNVKGMATCKICGRYFPLIVEDHYVAQDVKREGSIYTLVGGDKIGMFDAFDCPHCGCQNVMQNRKPECPCDYGICDECDPVEEEEEENDDE